MLLHVKHASWLVSDFPRNGNMFLRLKPINRTLLLPNKTHQSSHFSVKDLSYPLTKSHLQQNLNPQHLVSLLAKNPSNRNVTQQIHSNLVTSGFLELRPTLVLFNNLLRCYSYGDFPREAFTLYEHFRDCSLTSFDSFTCSFLLHACSNSDSVAAGFQVHGLTLKVGFHSHVYVQTALVNLYGTCGLLHEARRVFDEMPERNSVTWNVMISSLAKWGEFELAHSLFLRMPGRTVVSWTVIIDVFTRRKRYDEAVALFRRMVSGDDIRPTEVTLLAIIPAVSNLGDLKICQSIHAYGEKRGFNASDIRVANSLVDLYSKCGCIGGASRFFEELSSKRKNLVSWSSIISGFAMHGMGEQAVGSFKRMEEAGLKPNRVTFLSVLTGCSHGGLVEEGLKFFEKMVGKYGMTPDIKQYGCLIDMLGRTGRLEEAEKVALEIPSEISNVVIWRTLLGACSFHGDVEMGERVTRKIMEMERKYGGDYVLMSNIFASVGRYEDSEKLRRLLDKRNAFKVPGLSTV